MKTTILSWLILLGVCGAMFWFKAGDRAFWGRHGEARRAEVSREMIASGNWLIPQLNGDPFITKPPLYYWSAALVFTLTNTIDEFSARLPSLISGTLGVLLVALWGSVVFSRQVGLMAGIVLATNFLYCGMARTAGIDMMLTLWITAALSCFSMGLECRSHSGNPEPHDISCTPLFLVTAVWIGLGTMTKNPIGFAVPLLAMTAYMLLSKDFRLIVDPKPWWGLLIVLVICLPWFFLVYQRVPNFFEVLARETVGRYTDPDGTPHLEPFYYYGPALGAFAPWVMFVPAVIIRTISKGFRNLSRTHQFLLIAAVTTFVLFSSVGSKREYYLLPLYPVLALLVAKVWDEYIVMKHRTTTRWTWKSMDIPILGYAGLLGITGVALPIAAKVYVPHYFGHSLGFGLLCVGGGIVLGLLFVRQHPRAMFWTYTLATIGLYVFTLITIIPEMDRYRSRKEFLREARDIVGEAPLADFHYEGFDVQFYMQRLVEYRFGAEDLTAYLDEDGARFVLTTGKRYDQLHRENPELVARLAVRLDRVWISATEPGRQKRLVLLQKE